MKKKGGKKETSGYVVRRRVVKLWISPRLLAYCINVSRAFSLSSIKPRCSFEWRCPLLQRVLCQCGYEFHQNFGLAVARDSQARPSPAPFPRGVLSPFSMARKTRTSPLIPYILIPALSPGITRALMNARMFYRRAALPLYARTQEESRMINFALETRKSPIRTYENC